MISQVMKMCEELGLHRQASLEQKYRSHYERFWAIRLFWCVYVLNRRWGFGCGLSFALQDSDIDPNLHHPVGFYLNYSSFVYSRFPG